MADFKDILEKYKKDNFEEELQSQELFPDQKNILEVLQEQDRPLIEQEINQQKIVGEPEVSDNSTIKDILKKYQQYTNQQNEVPVQSREQFNQNPEIINKLVDRYTDTGFRFYDTPNISPEQLADDVASPVAGMPDSNMANPIMMDQDAVVGEEEEKKEYTASSMSDELSKSLDDVSKETEQIRKKEIESPISKLMKELRDLKSADESSLQDARKMQGIMAGLGEIMKGINKFSAAKAGGGLTQLKADTSAGESLAKFGDLGVTQAKEDIALRKDRKKELLGDIETASKLDALDPNSQRSKIYSQLVGSRLSDKLGMDVDMTGMTANDAIRIAQSIGQLGAVSDPEEKKLKLEKMRMDIEKSKAQAKKYSASVEEYKNMNSESRKVLLKTNSTIKGIDSINLDDKYLGPLVSEANNIRSKFDPEAAKVQFETNRIINKMIKEMAGTAVSQQEMKRVLSEMATTDMTPKVFKSRLRAIREKAIIEGKAALELEDQYGNDVSKTMEMYNNYESSLPSYLQEPKEMIMVRDTKTNRVVRHNKENAKKLLKNSRYEEVK